MKEELKRIRTKHNVFYPDIMKEELKKIRAKYGVAQKDLGRLMGGISQTFIYDVERGRRYLRDELILEIEDKSILSEVAQVRIKEYEQKIGVLKDAIS